MSIGGEVAWGVAAGIHVIADVEQAQAKFAQLKTQVGGHLNAIKTNVRSLDLEFRGLDHTLGYILAGTLVLLAKRFVETAAEIQRTSLLLVNLEGSTQGANNQMERMFTLVQKVPFSLHTMQEAFLKLKASGIEPIIDAQGNGPLRNLMDAVAAFGGTDDNLNRAAIAMQQMAGKGVISMEELRQQLGEAVPTAMRVMAEQMHMSMAQFVTDVSKGRIDAETGLAALDAGFQKHYHGIAEAIKQVSLSGAWQNFLTQIQELAVALDKTGIIDIFTAALHGLTDQLQHLNDQFKGADLSGAVSGFLDAIGAHADQIAGFINGITQLGTIVVNVSAMILSMLESLPPEVMSIGIIGFIVAGKRGLGAGIVIGQVVDQLGLVVSAIAGLVNLIDRIIPGGIKNIATMGFVGWFLLGGKKGLLIALASEAVNTVFNQIDRRIATTINQIRALGDAQGTAYNNLKSGKSLAHPIESYQDIFKTYQTSLDKYQAQYEAARTKFGNETRAVIGKITGTVQTDEVSATNVTNAIDALKAYQAQIIEARKKLGEMGRDPIQDVAGLNASQLKQYTQLLDDANAAMDRAIGATQGPAQQYLATQQRKFVQFDNLIKNVKKSQQELVAKGDLKGAAALEGDLKVITKQYDDYKDAVYRTVAAEEAKVNARLGAKAQRAHDKLVRELEQEKRTIDDVTSNLGKFQAKFEVARDQALGQDEFTAAADQARAKFASYTDQLNDMATAIGKLKHNEQQRADILKLIASLQGEVNDATEAAIELAKKQAAWQIEDTQTSADRQVRDLYSQLNSAKNKEFGFNRQEDFKQIADDWQRMKDQIDDQIKEYQRKIDENAQSVNNVFLEEKIQELEKLKAAWGDFYEYMLSADREAAEATRDMWMQTGQIVRNSMEDAIYALISGTGDLKSVILDMYAQITKAAIAYIMKLIIIKMLESSGNPYLMAAGQFLSGTMPSFPGLGGGGGGMPSGSFQMPATGGMAAANGRVMMNGRPTAFAAGGTFTNRIVTGPTLFNMGLMGESGPEGILPLTRVGGKLGVHASGGGDQYHISIQALDASSVVELFYKHGGSLIDVMRSQGRLNNGVTKSRF